MQFIYVLQLNEKFRYEKNWTDETNEIVGKHFAYLKGLYENGIMKLVGKTDYGVEHESNRGYAIFEAEDEVKAKEIMLNDPCIMAGVMRADLHPFRIALG